MIKSLLGLALLSSLFLTSIYCVKSYERSSTACVTVAGAIIKSQHVDIAKKYKRSECPVCKGKGWYMSGDDIEKIKCQYCEPDKKTEEPPKPIIRRR